MMPLICLYKPGSFWVPADPWNHRPLLRFNSHDDFSLVLADDAHHGPSRGGGNLHH